MREIHVVETNEFGDDFEFINGVWKVRFPPQTEPLYKLSDDAKNAVVLKEDEIFLNGTKLYAYIMVQDDEKAKVFLYRHPAGTEFNVTTAVQVGAADMIELNALIDDINITDAIIEFSDVHSGNELSFDTNLFQKLDSLSPQFPFALFDSSVSNNAELHINLKKGEGGGHITIVNQANGEVIVNLDNSDFGASSPIDVLNSNLNPEYKARVEFYYQYPQPNWNDPTLSVAMYIKIRNLSDHPLTLSIQVESTDDEDEVTGLQVANQTPSSITNWVTNQYEPPKYYVDITLAANELPPITGLEVSIDPSPDNNIQINGDRGLFISAKSLGSISQSLHAFEYTDPEIDGRLFEQLNHEVHHSQIGWGALNIPLINLVNCKGKPLVAIIKTLDGKLPPPLSEV